MSVVCNAIERAVCAAMLFLTAVSAPLIWAQSGSGIPLSDAGSWEIGVRATEFGVINRGGALLTTAGIRYGRVLGDLADLPADNRLRGTLEYTIDALPMFLMTRPSAIYGAALLPAGFKWNFLADPRRRPYAEANFGCVLSTRHLPPGDTNISFNVNAGGGLALLIRRNQALTAGLDYSHLSNAYLGPRNPNFNGISFVLEYHWFKPR